MHLNRFYGHFELEIFSLGSPLPTERGHFSRAPPSHPLYTHTRAFDTRKTHTTFRGRTTFQKPTTALESVSGLY